MARKFYRIFIACISIITPCVLQGVEGPLRNLQQQLDELNEVIELAHTMLPVEGVSRNGNTLEIKKSAIKEDWFGVVFRNFLVAFGLNKDIQQVNRASVTIDLENIKLMNNLLEVITKETFDSYAVPRAVEQICGIVLYKKMIGSEDWSNIDEEYRPRWEEFIEHAVPGLPKKSGQKQEKEVIFPDGVSLVDNTLTVNEDSLARSDNKLFSWYISTLNKLYTLLKIGVEFIPQRTTIKVYGILNFTKGRLGSLIDAAVTDKAADGRKQYAKEICAFLLYQKLAGFIDWDGLKSDVDIPEKSAKTIWIQFVEQMKKEKL